MTNNLVVIVLKKPGAPEGVVKPAFRRRRRAGRFANDAADAAVAPDQEFEIELEVAGRRNNQLRWTRYDVAYTYHGAGGGRAVRSPIDVSNAANFPNMVFSRVTSYTNRSENMLE